LIQKWGIQDDGERLALLEQSPKESLALLVDVIAPKFEEINHYLESFGIKLLPNEATALSVLAEAANEAMLMLKKVRP
jgi:hypothetical protein